MQLVPVAIVIVALVSEVLSQGAPLAFGRNIRSPDANFGSTGGYRPGGIPVPYAGGNQALLAGDEKIGAPAVLPIAPSGVNFQNAIGAAVGGKAPPAKVHVVEARQEGPQVIRVEQHQAPDQVIRVIERPRSEPEVHTVVEPPDPPKVIRVISKPGAPPHIVRVVHPAPEPQVYTVVKDGGPPARIVNVIKAPEPPPYVEFVKDYDAAPEITVHSIPGNPQVYDERLIAPGVGYGPIGGLKVVGPGAIAVPPTGPVSDEAFFEGLKKKKAAGASSSSKASKKK